MTDEVLPRPRPPWSSGGSFALRRAFTLVEVLMAAFILSILATGTIATTWRLCGFARLKASELAAESFCSDIAMAYFAQDLKAYEEKRDDRASTDEDGNWTYKLVRPGDVVGSLTRTSGTLYDWMPKFVPAGATREEDKVIPFWRTGYKNPTFTATLVKSKTNDVHIVTVTLNWGLDDGNPEHDKHTTFSMYKSCVGWSSTAGEEENGP